MRSGQLDRKITIQRKTLFQSDTGEEVESWAAIVMSRSASVAPVSGNERFVGEQIGARQQVKFTVRWSQEIADLSPLDRVVYPASAVTDSPSLRSSIYDVLAVNEIGRHEALQIVAVRHPDVA